NIYDLSLPVKPGTDSCSKALFRTEKVEDILISSVVGDSICTLAYYIGPTEHNDNTRSDIVYYPKDNKKNLPFIIVEIQNKVIQEFITRLMRYSLNIFGNKKTLPLFVIVNINGFSSKRFREEGFIKQENEPYYSLRSSLWAKKVYIYNADSIAPRTEVPMPEMIALIHFSTQQQKHIVFLDEYMDPALQKIYNIASELFNEKFDNNVIQDTQIESFCNAITSQVKK
ncbi:hypothetical protein BD408DRAFT_329605, partial [Parasitella parasitica]